MPVLWILWVFTQNFRISVTSADQEPKNEQEKKDDWRPDLLVLQLATYHVAHCEKGADVGFLCSCVDEVWDGLGWCGCCTMMYLPSFSWNDLDDCGYCLSASDNPTEWIIDDVRFCWPVCVGLPISLQYSCRIWEWNYNNHDSTLVLLVAVVAEVALEGKVAASFVVAAGFAVALHAGCSCGDAGGNHFGIIPRINALFTIYIIYMSRQDSTFGREYKNTTDREYPSIPSKFHWPSNPRASSKDLLVCSHTTAQWKDSESDIGHDFSRNLTYPYLFSPWNGGRCRETQLTSVFMFVHGWIFAQKTQISSVTLLVCFANCWLLSFQKHIFKQAPEYKAKFPKDQHWVPYQRTPQKAVAVAWSLFWCCTPFSGPCRQGNSVWCGSQQRKSSSETPKWGHAAIRRRVQWDYQLQFVFNIE